MRTVLGLRVLLVVDLAISERPHILTTLEVEGQRHRDPPALGPNDAGGMILAEHVASPRSSSALSNGHRGGVRHRRNGPQQLTSIALIEDASFQPRWQHQRARARCGDPTRKSR